MSQSGGQNPRLARASTRQDKDRAFGRFDGGSLLRVQPLQVIWAADSRQIADTGRGQG